MRLNIGKKGFAFPYLALSVLFVIIPLFILLFYSFTDKSGSFTFDNFVYFFTTDAVWKVLSRATGMAFWTTVICLVLAYPLAMLLANSKINKSSILVLLFVLPMWINFMLRMYALKNLFAIMGIDKGYFAVLIGMVYDYFPFMLLSLYTILAGMDKSYNEAARDLGASALERFLKVTLPLSLPGVVSGVLMVFMPTISTFAVSDMLGDSDTYMFGNLINQFFTAGNYNRGSALAIAMLLLVIIVLGIANLSVRGRGKIETGRSVKI